MKAKKQEENMKKKVLDFISNILAFGCLGTIVDYFTNKDYLFTLIGLGVGIIVAIIIAICTNKKGKEK